MPILWTLKMCSSPPIYGQMLLSRSLHETVLSKKKKQRDNVDPLSRNVPKMVTFTEAILEPRLQDCFGKCDILLYCLIKVLKTAVFSDLRRYSKHRSNLFILIFFMLQHIMESIEEKNKVKKLKEADITQEALMKLIQITIFLVKNIGCTLKL